MPRAAVPFWDRVVGGDVDTCWLWTGALSSGGYGGYWDGSVKQSYQAHRWSYEQLVGPIPAGLQLDHLCRNRACVNPWHLEPVTQRVNLLRGESPSALAARKTHCPQGHPYSGHNLMIEAAYGGRRCRICKNRRRRESRARKNLAASAA